MVLQGWWVRRVGIAGLAVTGAAAAAAVAGTAAAASGACARRDRSAARCADDRRCGARGVQAQAERPELASASRIAASSRAGWSASRPRQGSALGTAMLAHQRREAAARPASTKTAFGHSARAARNGGRAHRQPGDATSRLDRSPAPHQAPARAVEMMGSDSAANAAHSASSKPSTAGSHHRGVEGVRGVQALRDHVACRQHRGKGPRSPRSGRRRWRFRPFSAASWTSAGSSGARASPRQRAREHAAGRRQLHQRAAQHHEACIASAGSSRRPARRRRTRTLLPDQRHRTQAAPSRRGRRRIRCRRWRAA